MSRRSTQGRGGTPDQTAQADRHYRLLWWIALAVAVVVAFMAARLLTISTPDVALHTTAATSVRLPGDAPKPAWPQSGEAAFAVDGLGSLGSSGTDAPRPIASLTKVMTAYLILKQHPLTAGDDGFTLTITAAQAQAEAADVAQDESVVAVSAGERLTERQLLEALLIPSGDNIAQILAAYDAGSVPAFVAKMNREAKSLGMTATTYTDPSGFEPSTVSDAHDQLIIFRRAMRFPLFKQIVAMPSVTLPVAGLVENYDPLIYDGYYGKTGSDSQAEGCLAFFRTIKVGGQRLTEVGVVIGQGEGSDTSLILGAAGDAAADLATSVTKTIKIHTLLRAGSTVMRAKSADGDSIHGVTGRSLRVIGWGGMRERLALNSAPAGTTVRRHQRLGVVKLAGTLPTPAGSPTHAAVRASGKLSAPGLGWRLGRVF